MEKVWRIKALIHYFAKIICVLNQQGYFPNHDFWPANQLMKQMNRLLFLCTGNYYRSRFAEIFFNSLASEHGLNWKADSRGLALDLTGGNLGPMSDVAFDKLTNKGIRCASTQRFPKTATNDDFQAADLIIALDEVEHRPMMRERFPGWEQKTDYWLVHDLDQWEAKKALSLIETEVSQLVNQLRKKAGIATEPGNGVNKLT